MHSGHLLALSLLLSGLNAPVEAKTVYSENRRILFTESATNCVLTNNFLGPTHVWISADRNLGTSFQFVNEDWQLG